MHPMLNIAIRAARAAGNIIIRHSTRLDELTISSKRQNDFVSEVDEQAEAEIIRIISKAYPQHAFLGEESGRRSGEDFEWVIDPLDGTTNFLHGFPQYAVSIAARQCETHTLEVGVIYNPLSQELFAANRGAGATLNNKRIRVSNRRHLDGALLATGFPFKENQNLDAYLALLKRMMQITAGIRRAGSAALDLAYTAAGRVDGFWEMGLNVWDMAAGILILKEAGGLAADFNGGDDYMQSGNIICGSPKVFQQMLEEHQRIAAL